MTGKELKRLAGVLASLRVAKMPLAEPPLRDSRFGSPLQLSKVHWVRPQVVVEVTYLTWTDNNLLRQVSYQVQREDKPARQLGRKLSTSTIRRMAATPTTMEKRQLPHLASATSFGAFPWISPRGASGSASLALSAAGARMQILR